MTDRQRQAQQLSFAYGNLALTSNHKPARLAMKQLAMKKFGWTEAEFDAWARDREWVK